MGKRAFVQFIRVNPSFQRMFFIYLLIFSLFLLTPLASPSCPFSENEALLCVGEVFLFFYLFFKLFLLNLYITIIIIVESAAGAVG